MMVTRAPEQFHERYRLIILQYSPAKLQSFQTRAAHGLQIIAAGDTDRHGLKNYNPILWLQTLIC